VTAARILVLGGARSGKSRFAERLVEAGCGEAVYIATAEALDAEMAERIAAHRARRQATWRTVEEPDDLEGALGQAAAPGRSILVDCLTLWLSNAFGADAEGRGAAVPARIAGLVAALRGLPGRVVLVSNEVGLGLVPETKLGRDFRDAQGRLNQEVAAVCDTVVFVAAGLPLVLKGELP